MANDFRADDVAGDAVADGATADGAVADGATADGAVADGAVADGATASDFAKYDRADRSLSWRLVDIITAAVLGVACGLIFWVWNGVGGAGFSAFDALTPGLGGLVTGIWVLGAVLGGLIIRKPGAALFVEVIAASVSAILGSQWGITTLYSGVAQGLAAELIFALFLYRRFTLEVAVLAGLAACAGEWALELFTSGNLAMSWTFNLIYLGCMAVSGALLGGLVGWLLMRGLAATGVLDRFAAGREHRELV